MKSTNRHHRQPKSLGGPPGPPNVVRVNPVKHSAWHVMFGDMSPQEIVEEINNIWIDPRFKIVLKPTIEEPPY